VVNVSWEEANAFASWLSDRSGQPIRLPTEAEWEFAARAGANGDYSWDGGDARAYLFANVKAQEDAGYIQDGFVATAPIGAFEMNEWGLFDMLGNASEWVLDNYSPTPDRFGAALKDPLFEDGSALRLRRGGSFDDPLAITSLTTRDYYPQAFAVPQTGFRLVLAAPSGDSAQ